MMPQSVKGQSSRDVRSALGIERWANFLQYGILAILTLMPFHAFLSVWLGSNLGNSAIIQAWKEILILILLIPGAFLSLKKPNFFRQPLIIAIAAYASISLVVSLIGSTPLVPLVFGVKTNLVFLALFSLAWLTSSPDLLKRATQAFLVATGAVIAFGLIQIFFLPADFLANFGYGPDTVVPYQTISGPEESIRILSTLGGPNQLGCFLILPLCLVLSMLLRRPRWWHAVYLIAGLTVVFHTYSRSAWLGLIAAGIFTILLALNGKKRLIAAAIAAGILAISATGLTINFDNPTIQKYLLHGSTAYDNDSTDQHADALEAGLESAGRNPFGAGLGSAGPASFYSEKPFVPENYYLQLAFEVGLAGLILFFLICILLAHKLWQIKRTQPLAIPVLAALVGVSVVNLFLHGWTDSSTALTYWAYAGIVIGSKT